LSLIYNSCDQINFVKDSANLNHGPIENLNPKGAKYPITRSSKEEIRGGSVCKPSFQVQITVY